MTPRADSVSATSDNEAPAGTVRLTCDPGRQLTVAATPAATIRTNPPSSQTRARPRLRVAASGRTALLADLGRDLGLPDLGGLDGLIARSPERRAKPAGSVGRLRRPRAPSARAGPSSVPTLAPRARPSRS